MATSFLSEYVFFLYLFCFSVLIALVLLTLNFLLKKIKSKTLTDTEKLSAYECGFEPFEEARLQFNVHYYVIAIIFLIFDIEIVYLLPGICIFTDLPATGFFAFTYFLLILTIGFIYE